MKFFLRNLVTISLLHWTTLTGLHALAAEQPSLGSRLVAVESQCAGKISPGYLFWHQADELRSDVENVTLLLDESGRLRHLWNTNLTGGGHTSYLLPSGGLLRMGIREQPYVADQPVAATDTLQITNRSGSAIWELHARQLSFNGNKLSFHHDAILIPNGNILALIYEEISPAEASALGWTAGNGNTVWSDGIVEIQPNLADGTFDLIWVWRFVDHLIQDQVADAATHGVVRDHPDKIDGHFPKSYMPTKAVRQHLNSIDYHPRLNQIMVSAFIYNEIWIIDRRNGELLFRYGNPAAYGRGSPEDRLFAKQHDANWIDAGLPGADNVLVFNNNVQLPTPPPGMTVSADGPPAIRQEELTGISEVHEIRPTAAADGGYATNEKGEYLAESVWRWEDDDFFAPFQGGARRLPNGNTLLTDTVGMRVWEVDAAGEVVARYRGSTSPFKVFKYPQEAVRVLLGSGGE